MHFSILLLIPSVYLPPFFVQSQEFVEDVYLFMYLFICFFFACYILYNSKYLFKQLFKFINIEVLLLLVVAVITNII